MPITFIDEGTVDQYIALKAESRIVLYDFWAPWCGPCVMLGETIHKNLAAFEAEMPTLTIMKMNVNDDGNNEHKKINQLADKLDITAIPQLIVTYKGKAVKLAAGSFNNDIKKIIHEIKRAAKAAGYTGTSPSKASSPVAEKIKYK